MPLLQHSFLRTDCNRDAVAKPVTEEAYDSRMWNWLALGWLQAQQARKSVTEWCGL